MKKENNAKTYANLGFVIKAPNTADKYGARAGVSKSSKDLRGGKK